MPKAHNVCRFEFNINGVDGLPRPNAVRTKVLGFLFHDIVYARY